MFGDVVVYDDKYYLFCLDVISNFIQTNLLSIKNSAVNLEIVDNQTLKDYEPKFLDGKVIVSSLRIDTVIAHIINVPRKEVITKIKNKEIFLNYNILTKSTYELKENDIFSIRRYGKYRYEKILNVTKKNNYIIKYQKYL